MTDGAGPWGGAGAREGGGRPPGAPLPAGGLTRPPRVPRASGGAAAMAFEDPPNALARVTFRGAVKTVLTLGIFRFWMRTHQRRTVWHATRLGGEPFEYDGTAGELLRGFLVVVVVLALLLGAANLALTWAGLATDATGAEVWLPALTALLAAPLIPLARWRARRYQAARTRWRGIRFRMEGTGLGLVGLWALWALPRILTLNLVGPFWHMGRERMMTRATFWGDAPFDFRGGAWPLMPVWAGAWASALALPLAVLLALLLPLLAAARQGEGRAAAERALEASGLPEGVIADASAALATVLDHPALQSLDESAAAIAAMVIFLASPLILLLWWLLSTTYEAARLRAVMRARSVAGAGFDCRLRAGALRMAQVAVAWRAALWGIAISATSGAVAALLHAAVPPAEGQTFTAVQIVPAAVTYGGLAVLSMYLSVAVHLRRVHGALCAATQLRGTAGLSQVEQGERDRAREAGGLADALDIGGL